MMSKEQIQKNKLNLLTKKIIVLRTLLDEIQSLKNVEDKLKFLELIGGIVAFLETNLDTEFK